MTSPTAQEKKALNYLELLSKECVYMGSSSARSYNAAIKEIDRCVKLLKRVKK